MRLLDAALPLVTSHGFTRAALLEASHSLSMPLSPQTLDGLFPAPSSAHDGPALALLRHWSAAQTQSTVQHLQSLKENNNNNNKVVGLVSAGFQRRLELNEPLKDRLPGAWSHRVFGRQLPDLRGFYRHAQGVSGSIAQAARLPDQVRSLLREPSCSADYIRVAHCDFERMQDAPSTLQTSKLATIYAAAGACPPCLPSCESRLTVTANCEQNGISSPMPRPIRASHTSSSVPSCTGTRSSAAPLLRQACSRGTSSRPGKVSLRARTSERLSLFLSISHMHSHIFVYFTSLSPLYIVPLTTGGLW